MVISMADGSHATHYDDNSLSKLFLSHRDSSTAEVVAKAMEDSLNDGVYRSGNDSSYARPLVTDLPSASSSDGIRVLQPVNTTDLSSAIMADGVPMTDERFEDIHSLVRIRFTFALPVQFVSPSKMRAAASKPPVKNSSSSPVRFTSTKSILHVESVYFGPLKVVSKSRQKD